MTSETLHEGDEAVGAVHEGGDAAIKGGSRAMTG